MSNLRVDCCGFDEPVLPEDCLANAATRRNKCGFTYEVLASLFSTQQSRGEKISTTVLTTKCLRSEFLQRNELYVEEPKDMWAAWRGTMFHGQLEKHVAPGCIEEARYYVDLPGLGLLTGSPDLVDPVHGTLYDYKNTGSMPRFGTPWPDHVLQNQINRWLVDHASKVEYQDAFYDLSRPKTRARFVPPDWQGLFVVYMDDKGTVPMLIFRSEKVPTKAGGTKNARVPDIWPDDIIEAEIRRRYAAAKTALVDKVLPEIPPGFENQAHVLCNYCPKKARCRELELEVLLAPNERAAA